MKVILLHGVERLGEKGEVVEVKDGFARNYLFPKKLAFPATQGGIKMFEEEKKREATRGMKEKRLAEELAGKLETLSLMAVAKAGEDGKLYGSVTAADIVELLKKEGYEIEKKNILLESPIKSLGVFMVPIKLHREVEGRVKVWIVKE